MNAWTRRTGARLEEAERALKRWAEHFRDGVVLLVATLVVFGAAVMRYDDRGFVVAVVPGCAIAYLLIVTFFLHRAGREHDEALERHEDMVARQNRRRGLPCRRGDGPWSGGSAA